MTREQAMAKVSKLLALGESNNEHEAAQALARATALMERFEIERADLGEDDDEDMDYHVLEGEGEAHKRAQRWRGILASQLAQANGCAAGWYGRRIRVFGRKADADLVRELFKFATREIARLAPITCAGLGRSAFHSFRQGAVDAIAAAVWTEKRRQREEMKQQYAGTMAMTVVDDRAERAHKGYARKMVQTQITDPHSYLKGVEAGERIMHSRRNKLTS